MASFPGQYLLDGATFRSTGLWTSHVGAIWIDDTDSQRPVILNIDPPPGEPVYKFTTVSFELQDAKGFRLVEIQVDQTTREVVYDGETFLYPYLSSTRVESDPGKRFYFQIKRTGGWIATPVWRVRALDAGFNEPTNP